MTRHVPLPDVQPGARIELVEMPNDPLPIPVGTTGTVRRVIDLHSTWQIDVDWDIDRSLFLVPGDRWRTIT